MDQSLELYSGELKEGWKGEGPGLCDHWAIVNRTLRPLGPDQVELLSHGLILFDL